MSSISARIERLPFGRFHRRLLLMGGLGYTFDGLDAAVIAFVLPVVMKLWGLTSVETGVLGSANFIGFLFGALTAGLLGDRIGRRPVMMYALALYTVASLVSAFAHSWPVFFWTRVLAGLGTGAESAIVAPYLAEFVARRMRGGFTGALAGFFSFGFVGAALLGYFIVPTAPQAWRTVLALTALPVVMLLWWRRALPESPRWLEAQGRMAEASQVLDRMEAEAEGALPPLDAAAAPPPLANAGRRGFAVQLAALLSPGLRRITVMTWLMWLSITFSYYAFFTWIPTLLVQSGMTITRSFGYSIAIYLAQIPGYYTAAWLNERIGRQAVIASYMVLGGISALVMSMAHTPLAIMICGIFLSFFMNGTYAGVYAYTPEVFPTDVRTTGTGLASAIGRLGSIASPIIVGFIFPRLGFGGVFGMTTVVLLVGAVAVLVLGVRTLSRSLEDIAREELAPTR